MAFQVAVCERFGRDEQISPGSDLSRQRATSGPARRFSFASNDREGNDLLDDCACRTVFCWVVFAGDWPSQSAAFPLRCTSVSSQETNQPTGEFLSRIEQLVVEFGESRGRLSEFSQRQIEELETFGGRLIEQLAQVQPSESDSVEKVNYSESEVRDLCDHIVELESQLESLQQELQAERDNADSRVADLDQETRQLLDDLVEERDTLRGELENLRGEASDRKKADAKTASSRSSLRDDLESMRGALDPWS